MICPYIDEFRRELAAHRREVREMMQAHFDEMFRCVQPHMSNDGDRPSVTVDVNLGKLASSSSSSRPTALASLFPANVSGKARLAAVLVGGLGAIVVTVLEVLARLWR
jgi:hypothetical protein